jgi:hypothetical protein
MAFDMSHFNVLIRHLNDDDLSDRLNETQLRMDALDQIEREHMDGLSFDERSEYRMLRAMEARLRTETSRRRSDATAAQAIVVANEYHDEHPDLLALLRAQDPVALVKVVYGMSDDDLKVIKRQVRLLEVLADKVLDDRQTCADDDPTEG